MNTSVIIPSQICIIIVFFPWKHLLTLDSFLCLKEERRTFLQKYTREWE